MANENHHWFRKWLRFEPHDVIGEADDPYLLRWFVLPHNRLLKIYLHKFLRSDEDRALHDHPWWFFSWILKGEYLEHVPVDDPAAPSGVTGLRWRSRWSIAYRSADWTHRIQLLPDVAGREKPVWTLIITGPKLREWGFWCPKGWVHWRYFTHHNGCGEYA
ncbi:hypothetical protein A5747_13505 [Mycobacterium sp. IS-836]|uniref:hypothetical protein n=1 Tax=Mycobacterium sp. IS-836 TaxID=1834160 RepID=UPI00096D7AAA|nr:hypothetical protein [Mycobacterium sp. IS-836]OMC55404.1 hypothetical protein A5747_13505 [Mycobacterium sp. IS-836]